VNDCPHCGKPVFRKSADGSKLKARTRIVVLHKASGTVEINCESCGKGILLPVTASADTAIRKAEMPRLVARRG